jgi:hypothetical protein
MRKFEDQPANSIIAQLGLAEYEKYGPIEDWDEELFLEAYDFFYQEYQSADKEGKRKLLMERFFDAHFARQDHDESKMAEAFLVGPPAIYVEFESRKPAWLKKEHYFAARNIDLEQGKLEGRFIKGPKVRQYGPSRTYYIEPGELFFVPQEQFGQQDIMGSAHFSRCTAICVKHDKGYFFSHVTGYEDQIKKVLQEITVSFGQTAKVIVVRPEKTNLDGSKDDQYNKRYEEIEKLFPAFTYTTYPYVSAESQRPKNTFETAVVMTSDSVQVMGTSPHGLLKKKTGKAKQIVQIAEQTRVTIEF